MPHSILILIGICIGLALGTLVIPPIAACMLSSQISQAEEAAARKQNKEQPQC